MKILTSIKTLILLLLALITSAQNSFKIKGQIDTFLTSKYKSEELILRLKKNASKDQNDISIVVPIDSKGQFNAELNIPDSTNYVAFELKDNRVSNKTGFYYNISQPARTNPFSEVYLFAKGDDVTMNIKFDNSIQFKGNGSEKLNCQFLLYNLLTLPKAITERAIQLENKRELEKSLHLEIEGIKTQSLYIISLLKSYKTEFKNKIYEQLQLDAISAVKQQFYYKAPNYYLLFPNKENQEIVKKYFQVIDTLYSELNNDVSDVVKAQSAFYITMLLEKEVSKLIVFNNKRYSYNAFSFEALYKAIKSEHRGIIRDKLILIAFENYAVKKADELKKVYPDAKHTVQDKTINAQIANLMEKYNANTFPFVFYDENNKPYKLQDFKGKVIVMDFWFTSCSACTVLAKAMHPIFEKYKNRNDIVFITISTDLKDKWLEAVKSEKYSSKGMLNLHTNGKGFNDPMIIYYKFKSFPRQLIIDKDGQLISSSPPRPDAGETNVLAFKKLIEKALEK